MILLQLESRTLESKTPITPTLIFGEWRDLNNILYPKFALDFRPSTPNCLTPSRKWCLRPWTAPTGLTHLTSPLKCWNLLWRTTSALWWTRPRSRQSAPCNQVCVAYRSIVFLVILIRFSSFINSLLSHSVHKAYYQRTTDGTFGVPNLHRTVLAWFF